MAVVALDAEEAATHPAADRSLLIVEVADTSMRRDLRKGAIYAAAGAPVYWIMDVNRQVVTVHGGPRPDGTWEEVVEVGIDGELRLPGADATIPVAAILGLPAG